MKNLPENEQKALDIVIKYSRELIRELLDKGFLVQTDKKGTCPILRRAGIDVNAVAVDDNCGNCPMPRCILMGKNGSKKIPVSETKDEYHQCGECGVTADLEFRGGKLWISPEADPLKLKFHQEGNLIICGCGGICRKRG